MKRKDLHHDLSFIPFSPRKSPRLDVELLENMNEDPPIRVPQILEQGLLLQQQQQQPFTCSSNNMLQMAVAPLSMLSSKSLEERALLLYNQPLNNPFFKSPCSPDFPIVVNSALIPGLKEHFLALGNGKLGNSMEKEDTDKNPMVSNDSLAVVPWVSKSPSAGVSEAMETEEVEMMDTDYDSDSNISGQRAFEYDGMVQEAGELPHWQQQHSMQPHFLKNNSAPVEW
ncbi:hypothetical protein RGQ29_008192 [Quercus rubra]|uniref:Uncharacterized protein n=1 Tax=Quercus rubra TaxID=3512 RepID=A0AAN7DZJ0_QUERU|nr:hypothetical protein RGQ29_008192 [Quercus rubra]